MEGSDFLTYPFFCRSNLNTQTLSMAKGNNINRPMTTSAPLDIVTSLGKEGHAFLLIVDPLSIRMT